MLGIVQEQVNPVESHNNFGDHLNPGGHPIPQLVLHPPTPSPPGSIISLSRASSDDGDHVSHDEDVNHGEAEEVTTDAIREAESHQPSVAVTVNSVPQQDHHRLAHITEEVHQVEEHAFS